MSVLSYNGITLPYADITQFTQEAVYDDKGHTDWICTKYDIGVQGIINADFIQSMAPQLVGGNTPTIAAVALSLHQTLMRPRRRLSFRFNNVELIPAITPTAGHQGFVDVQNGPQPQSFTFTELTNESFYFTYRIIAHYWMNLLINPNADPQARNRLGNRVLFNRWTETIDIDSCGYTKRSRDGKFMIRSDNENGQIVDLVRSNMAVVGCPNGFLRNSARYTVSADGLGIEYSITDKEQYKMPPYKDGRPVAYEAEGEYTETSTGPTGAIRYGEVWVRLRGGKARGTTGISENGGPVFSPQQWDQALLVQTAVRVARSKLILNNRTSIATLPPAGPPTPVLTNPRGPSPGTMQQAQIKVWLYDNQVEVRMRSILLPGIGRLGGIAGLRSFGFVYTPGSDERENVAQVPPIYFDRGSAGLLMRSARYYDPSLANNELLRTGPIAGQMNNGLEPGQAGLRRET